MELKPLIANSHLLNDTNGFNGKIFGKTAQMTVLKNLIEKQGESTYLSGIAQETGLSHASVARVIAPFVSPGVVQEKMLGKNLRTFQLNKESEAANVIVDLYSKINQMVN